MTDNLSLFCNLYYDSIDWCGFEPTLCAQLYQLFARLQNKSIEKKVKQILRSQANLITKLILVVHAGDLKLV